MESTIVVLSPERMQTRLLMTRPDRDLLKAVLPPLTMAHPRAVMTLLEGLSLWTQQRLFVALAVDEEGRSFAEAEGLCDALGYGTTSVHFEVGVVPRRSRRRGQRLPGVGDFRDLRGLTKGELDR